MNRMKGGISPLHIFFVYVRLYAFNPNIFLIYRLYVGEVMVHPLLVI